MDDDSKLQMIEEELAELMNEEVWGKDAKKQFAKEIKELQGMKKVILSKNVDFLDAPKSPRKTMNELTKSITEIDDPVFKELWKGEGADDFSLENEKKFLTRERKKFADSAGIPHLEEAGVLDTRANAEISDIRPPDEPKVVGKSTKELIKAKKEKERIAKILGQEMGESGGVLDDKFYDFMDDLKEKERIEASPDFKPDAPEPKISGEGPPRGQTGSARGELSVDPKKAAAAENARILRQQEPFHYEEPELKTTRQSHVDRANVSAEKRMNKALKRSGSVYPGQGVLKHLMKPMKALPFIGPAVMAMYGDKAEAGQMLAEDFLPGFGVLDSYPLGEGSDRFEEVNKQRKRDNEEWNMDATLETIAPGLRNMEDEKKAFRDELPLTYGGPEKERMEAGIFDYY